MAEAIQIGAAYGGQAGSEALDHRIAALAAKQHGVVARPRLRAAGLTARAISRRVAAGRLHLVHRGVYAVGHCALGRRGEWMAAVLHGGAGAALSHRSAAALWRILPASFAPIEVTVTTGRASGSGVRFHRQPLPADERTVVEGIAVTGPSRTLCDLAAVIDRHTLARAAHEAEVRRLEDPLAVADVLARSPCRRGAGIVRALMAESGARGVTRSELEGAFLDLVVAEGLPPLG